MQKIPQIVRDRLRSGNSALDHPEADVLAAFSEQSLPEREKGQVFEHLARCQECRDIVSLALPQNEALSTVRPIVSRRWLSWPAFRWGFAVAGVIAVVSLGVLKYERVGQSPAMVAKNLNRDGEPAQVQPEAKPPAAALPEEDHQKALRTSNSNQTALTLPAQTGTQLNTDLTPPTHAPQRAFAATRGAGPKMPAQWQQSQSQSVAQQATSAPGPVPSSAAKQELARALENDQTSANRPAADISGASAEVISQNEVQQSPPASSSGQTSGVLFDRLARAKPAAAPESPSRAKAVNSALWTIGASGQLQRSMDQGSTWQNVDVSSSVVAGQSEYLYTMAAKSAPAASKDLRKEADKKATTALSATFRTVVAAGSEVWAGGNGGALYHSLDGGNHWSRVIPSSSGTILTGDIVQLNFSDSPSGTLTTATGEVWTTADNGQSWLKH